MRTPISKLNAGAPELPSDRRGAADRGEDVTDLVLLNLLPYEVTAGNREKDAWDTLSLPSKGIRDQFGCSQQKPC